MSESKSSSSRPPSIVSKHQNGTILTSFMHIVCATIGAGVFGLSKVVYESGYISLGLLVFVTILSYYSGFFLIECLNNDIQKKDRLEEKSDVDQNKKIESLADLGYVTYGFIGKLVVQFACYANMLGSGWVYIILCGKNLELLFRWINIEIEVKYWCLIIGILIAIPFCIFKSVKEAAWLSIFGMLSTAVAVVVICVYSIITISTPGYQFNTMTGADMYKVPFALATFAFAYGGAVIFPDVQGSLKNKKQWPLTVIVSVLFIFLVYLSVSLFGAFAYGSKVESPIYKNLKDGSTGYIITLVMITLHFLFATPVYLSPMARELEEMMGIEIKKMGKKKEFLFRVIFRILIMTVLTLLAIYVNSYEFSSGLIGSISNGIIIFIIPSLGYYKLYGFRNQSVLNHVKLILLFVVGLACLVLGTISSFEKLKKP